MTGTHKPKKTLTLNKRSQQPKPSEPKLSDHEIRLSTILNGGEHMRLITVQDEMVIGRLVSFDKFTVTIAVDMFDANETWEQTYFKHAISSFTTLPYGRTQEHLEEVAKRREESASKIELPQVNS